MVSVRDKWFLGTEKQKDLGKAVQLWKKQACTCSRSNGRKVVLFFHREIRKVVQERFSCGMPSPIARFISHKNRHKAQSLCLYQKRCCQAFPLVFFQTKWAKKIKRECQRSSPNHIWCVYQSPETAEISRADWRAWKTALQCKSETKSVSSFSKGEVESLLNYFDTQKNSGRFTPVIQWLDTLLKDALPWKSCLVWCVQNQIAHAWERLSCWTSLVCLCSCKTCSASR